mmetsp:Transcript_10578/g.15380  ORF Transcript_10578/g.15380 Transcript_10578/m.15380 type:complete len:92 (+) Transcript_10578:48-323(+)
MHSQQGCAYWIVTLGMYTRTNIRRDLEYMAEFASTQIYHPLTKSDLNNSQKEKTHKAIRVKHLKTLKLQINNVQDNFLPPCSSSLHLDGSL